MSLSVQLATEKAGLLFLMMFANVQPFVCLLLSGSILYDSLCRFYVTILTCRSASWLSETVPGAFVNRHWPCRRTQPQTMLCERAFA